MARKAKTEGSGSGAFFFQVYGSCDLRGDWSGWRIRGRFLVSPTGERILPRRLAGILWAEALRAQLPPPDQATRAARGANASGLRGGRDGPRDAA